MPKKINGKYVSKSVTTFIASRGGTDAMVKSIAAGIERGEAGYIYDRKSHNEAIKRTENLEPLIYLIPSTAAEVATGTAFYYNKAKAENKIKIEQKYGVKGDIDDDN